MTQQCVSNGVTQSVQVIAEEELNVNAATGQTFAADLGAVSSPSVPYTQHGHAYSWGVGNPSLLQVYQSTVLYA